MKEVAMLERTGNFFAEKVRKILPDSFVFAVLLTFITVILALTMTGAGPKEIIEAWVKGVFDSDIIFFAFLMIMVLTFGFCIGVSKPFTRFFNWLVRFIKKPWQVYFFLVILSILLMLVNWGLAPVLAILAVEICKRVKGVDYRVAIAAFYSGLLVWHGGMSSSAA
ncbi:MAG: short-chain fatty acid transporter, partial [Chrysiogenales bacterium]